MSDIYQLSVSVKKPDGVSNEDFETWLDYTLARSGSIEATNPMTIYDFAGLIENWEIDDVC